MSTTINDEKAIAGETSKILKLLAAIKKFLSKQLILILIIVIVSFPIAIMIEASVKEKAPLFVSEFQAAHQQIGLFMVIYFITAIGLYFAHMVLVAIQTLVKSKKASS